MAASAAVVERPDVYTQLCDVIVFVFVNLLILDINARSHFLCLTFFAAVYRVSAIAEIMEGLNRILSLFFYVIRVCRL